MEAALTVVEQQAVGCPPDTQVEIRRAVAVEIAGPYPMRTPPARRVQLQVQTGGFGRVREGAVPVVVLELVAQVRIVTTTYGGWQKPVTHVEIEVSIQVVVKPDGIVSGLAVHQARLFGHIPERAFVVAQQQIAPPLKHLPERHVEIQVAVVVVVSKDRAAAFHHRGDLGEGTALIGKPSRAFVGEQPPPVSPKSRDEQVRPVVVVVIAKGDAFRVGPATRQRPAD